MSWRPRLVALDIDGTLLKWVEGAGTTYEQIAPPVYDAVHRALSAGVHIVLASGRSPHGMTRIADLLDLHGDERDRLWVVASNGAVLFRYPPLEVVHEETFDAGPAVRAVLEQRPTALVAVEERGVGYRVSDHFPVGELSGEMILDRTSTTSSAEPVSRVIIRDPSATADDFVELAARLGLHGTDYVVGWTAWLDLAPVGVSKASGLAMVADKLARRPGRRARDRRRPQRHRDARVGRPRGRDGAVHRGGPGRGRRRDRDRVRRRRRGRAVALVPRRREPPAARRDRPRRHARPQRRHPLAAHPRRDRRARRARRTRRVRDRPAAALGRGGLPVRRRARPGGRLQRRAGLGRRAQRGRPGPRGAARGRARGLPGDPRGRAGLGVRRRDAGRDLRSRPSSSSATRSPTAAGAARWTRSSTPRPLKLLARHEDLRGAGVLGPRAGGRRRPRGGDLVVRVGAAGDQRGRGDQGVDAGRCCATGSASHRPT